MPNFADIATKRASEVERPPLAPTGTYQFRVTKLPNITEISSDKGQWDVVEFNCQALEAYDDVDLSSYPGDISNIQLRKAFMFDKNDEVKFQQTEYDLKRFLVEHCGIPEEDNTLMELVNQSVNARFAGTVKWNPDKTDPELFHANLGRTAPIE